VFSSRYTRNVPLAIGQMKYWLYHIAFGICFHHITTLLGTLNFFNWICQKNNILNIIGSYIGYMIYDMIWFIHTHICTHIYDMIYAYIHTYYMIHTWYDLYTYIYNTYLINLNLNPIQHKPYDILGTNRACNVYGQ
jgi:hypothetical protein